MAMRICGAVTCCLTIVASAHAASLYWTDTGGPSGKDVIMRANIDGSRIQTIVSGLEEPRGITLDLVNGYVYWAEPGSLAIRKAKLAGKVEPETVVSVGDNTCGLALDIPNRKIYWTDVGDPRGLNGRIRRANLDGSGVEDLVRGLRHPVAIALDPVHGKVYWTNLEGHLDGNGSIQRANLDGSNFETMFTGIDEAYGLAIDVLNGKLYWPELASRRIQRANLDGSALEDVLTGLDAPTSIDLDFCEGKMYWTSSGGQRASQISRSNLDGSGVETLVSGSGFPWGIVVVSREPEANGAKLRTWTSANGFTIEAEFVNVFGDRVTLRRADGKVITIPFKEFSTVDQAFINEWKKKRRR